MIFNDSLRYVGEALYCDSVPVADIAAGAGTPLYVYSLPRVLHNLERVRAAFAPLGGRVHYSIKANGNLALLRALGEAGVGMDAVSAGEIHRALAAGVPGERMIFAGVGKTPDELAYALDNGVSWFNVENVEECRILNHLAAGRGLTAQVALRLNPGIVAQTHRHIATGHGGAKFGLSAETVRHLLESQADYPALRFAGLHLHIGSQLHDTAETVAAVRKALELVRPYPSIRTLNIGGGIPVAYHAGEELPPPEAFAQALRPLLEGYQVILEPGRAIVADAGILVTRVLYTKTQGDVTFVMVDAGMTELIRPALYEAHHEIVPVLRRNAPAQTVQIVGPVCETTDVLGRDVSLPRPAPDDLLAIMTAGAYGMVMASNYNARPRPAEIIVDGERWQIARRRETWDDLLRLER
ncbi:MAG: diaminopimelate decarboxylase [Chloroflexota bacterium]|nr:MAG: diaminopimelate decarboxylase [Chloroflexota bacterium]